MDIQAFIEEPVKKLSEAKKDFKERYGFKRIIIIDVYEGLKAALAYHVVLSPFQGSEIHE